MSVTVTGKLNKAANQFQAGDGKGFGIRLGVKFYNRETKEQEYTNYEAVIFAKEGAQADFYASALVEGSVVELSGSGCQIKTFEGSNGPIHSISILDSKLGYVGKGDATQATAETPKITEDIPF
jgi:single-strand DNA-binding protein